MYNTNNKIYYVNILIYVKDLKIQITKEKLNLIRDLFINQLCEVFFYFRNKKIFLKTRIIKIIRIIKTWNNL